MADPVTILGITAGILEVLEVSFRLSQVAVGIQSETLASRYGQRTGFLISIFLRDTAYRYEKIEKDILHGSDEEALAFRQAITNECNMTAVAGAIIAQVAITGLSLPSLSETHWIARAFFLLAVVSGCLSVYYSCILNRIVGKLYQPEGIRNWLRLPPPGLNYDDDDPKASLPAVLIISAPFTMVKFSIFAFLAGLAIYQGFTWTRQLDSSAGKGDSRDVFITLMIGTGLCSIFFFLTFSLKNIETLLRTGNPYSASNEPRNQTLNRDSQWRELQNIHPTVPIQDADRVISGGLAAALEAAAQAHVRCADADRLVAIEYARIANNQTRDG